MYDIDAIGEKYPTTSDESMNTVLLQECIRYNGLLTIISKSLRETQKALKGLVVMSPELETVANSFFDNQVCSGDKWTKNMSAFGVRFLQPMLAVALKTGLIS